MRVLIDTVVFIWAASSPDRISRKAMAALQKPNAARELSVVSLVEIAIKQSAGKLTFAMEDVFEAIADLQLRVLPYATDHACSLFSLPVHHTDPFDRQIIAQALVENIPIVTPDEKFSLYKAVKVIW